MDGRRLLDVSAARARLAAPDLLVDTALVDGGAANILARHSEQARLIVVGHRDEVVARPSWGSTAAYLAHHCSCPLLVHRGGCPDEGPVVVAVSARSSATATIGYAYAEAESLRSRLVAVHVWSGSGDRRAPHPATRPSAATPKESWRRP